MNAQTYRQELRKDMTADEKKIELYRFSDYINNGFSGVKAKKNFNRKPYDFRRCRNG